MTQTRDQTMGRVTVEFTIANYHDMARAQDGVITPDQVRQMQLRGVVDTGATRLVLPESVVMQLGLPSAGNTGVRFADERRSTRAMVKDVFLRLQGRESVFSAIVEPARSDALIGAIVMEELDFLVDCTHQTIYPRDPQMIISEIE